MKKIAYLLLIISLQLQAQYKITGELTAENNLPTWLILYQLKGAEQTYILNEAINKGKFQITLPNNAEKGVYRLMYSTAQNSYIDFIFLKEDLDLKFNPTQPTQTLQFKTSTSNELYLKYIEKTTKLQQKIDSVQLKYFNLTTAEEKTFSENLYKSAIQKYVAIQRDFENKAIDSFTKSYIKQHQKYYAPEIFNSPQLYLNSEQKHFFDYLDINSDAFFNSSLFSNTIIAYVFYLNQSNDQQMQNALYKNAVDFVVEKVKLNIQVNSELQLLLLNSFAQLENAELVAYIIEKYYKKLPDEFQNKTYLDEVLNKIRVAIGQKAPNFNWLEKSKEHTLYNFNKTSKTLLVFWSTTCSHCLSEIPLLHEFYTNNKAYKIVAIALEENDEKFKKLKKELPKFTHILGSNKWENSIAKTYQITSTPTYFVLDNNKKIIAKPYSLNDVKAYFKN